MATPAEWQGKDSQRLSAAGAARVGLAHPGGVWLEAPGLAGAGPRALSARLMAGLHLVIVEGFKSAAIPKIEVVAPDRAPCCRRRASFWPWPGGAARGKRRLPVLDADNPRPWPTSSWPR